MSALGEIDWPTVRDARLATWGAGDKAQLGLPTHKAAAVPGALVLRCSLSNALLTVYVVRVHAASGLGACDVSLSVAVCLQCCVCV